jgi:hypothetical protein
VAAALAADEELARRAEAAVAVARLREQIGTAVLVAEASGAADGTARLRELLASPGALAAAVAEDGPRRHLAQELASAGLAGEAGAVVAEAVRVLKGWKAREPAASAGLRRDEARAEYGEAAAALLCDVALDRHVSAARRTLAFRTGLEAEGGEELEWEAGRLYRITARPGPIRRAAVERNVGHLFADIKDFTRRTSLLGQAAMAELLRREFYVPILTLAKEHFGGMGHLSDRGGVTVNNLIGDAISFSGRVETMVALARDVRRHFAAYSARLQREFSKEVLSRRLDTIEREHAAPIAAAGRARADAEAAVAAAPAGSQEHAAARFRLAQAAEEEARLLDEREKALARARGEAIEAGIFVSHGPSPLVVVIEDEVFGRQRVAIADKINESARGTARAAPARARADAELGAERMARKNPRLQHAWRVFIGQPLTIAVPPATAAEAVRAFAGGNQPAAMRLVAGPVRSGLEAAARAEGDAPGDIYNSGIALSEESLQAWLGEVAGARVVRRVDLAPDAVPEELRGRWFFGREPLNLVACFSEDGRLAEVFRRVGRAAFKGLGDVVVWELCDEAGGPGALFQALGPRWFREARG